MLLFCSGECHVNTYKYKSCREETLTSPALLKKSLQSPIY